MTLFQFLKEFKKVAGQFKVCKEPKSVLDAWIRTADGLCPIEVVAGSLSKYTASLAAFALGLSVMDADIIFNAADFARDTSIRRIMVSMVERANA